MERFTFRTVGGTAVLYLGNSSEWAIISGRHNHEYKISGDAAERLAAYEDTGLEPQDIISAVDMAKIVCALHELNAYKDIGPIDHIRDLLRAEQDGRLVMLPCKVGDHVWIDGRDAIVTEFFGYRSERYFHAVILGRNKHIDIPFNEIGKTVFLTREDAEAALKGGDG